MSGCYPCSPECEQCVNAPNRCTSCIEGYYHVSGKYTPCMKCPDFCPICNSPNDCSACAPGYYLNETSCLVCSTPNCYSCSNSLSLDQCTLCRNGYYLNSGQC